jgi:hypothetical protein
MARNKRFLATLMSLGYSVTTIDGAYVENFGTTLSSEQRENSYFVVDQHDTSDFISNIVKLGKKFCQDSVLIKPKNSESAYLHGTNISEFPSLDVKIPVGTFKGGIDSEFMSRIRGRPFIFKEASHYSLMTRGMLFDKIRKEVLGD